MLRLTTLICLVLLCFSGQSQVLKTTSLNLNSGGVINDVIHIPEMNAYLVVGKFTSIGGTAKTNVAFINATNFTVMSQAPITNMNGEVRSVEHYYIPAVTVGNLTTPGVHYLFMGGNFTMVNGSQKEYLVTLQYNETLNNLSPTSNFGIVNWNYQFNANDPTYVSGHLYGISDLAMNNDTLVVAGSFTEFYADVNDGIIDSYCFAGFKIDRTLTSKLKKVYTTLVPPVPYTGMGIGVTPTHYILAIADQSSIQNPDCYKISRNLSTPPVTFDISANASPQNDKWYSAFKAWDNVRMGAITNTGGTILFHSDGSVNSSGQEMYGINGVEVGTLGSIALSIGYDFYNGDMILVRERNTPPSSTIQRYSKQSDDGTFIGFTPVGTSTNISPNTAAQDFYSGDSSNRVVICNNKLFLSAPELTIVGGQTRTGFAVFCLEPSNPLPFIAPDAVVCEGDTVTYSIPDVQTETGYKWTYSGSGIDYSINNGPFIPYTAPVMNTTAGASSIKIRFPIGATSGTLTVEPYNTCNSTTDYLYAKPQTVAISMNPKPVLGINSNSSQFTCIVDTISIVATSSIPTVNYQWYYPNASTPISTNDSITIYGTGSPTVIYPDGTYYLTITEPTTGCFANGNIVISENTTPPAISQTDLSSNPPYFTCTTTQMVLSADVPGASVYWTTDEADTIERYPNPDTIYTAFPIYYYAFATDSVNGCKAHQQFQIAFDTVTVQGYLPNYSGFSAGSIVDTINCVTTSLNLQCDVVPSDPNASIASVFWVQNNQANLPLTIADSAGMFVNTQTYQFTALNTQNGCSVTKDVIVYFDLATPFVAAYNGAHSINCSVDTLTMVHLQTGGSVTEGWLDGTGTQTGSNSLFVNGTGTYIYNIVDNINGCSNADTVTVSQTSEMYLTGTSDTIVCPASQVTVSVSPVNVSESVTYLWSNGDTGNSTSLIGGTDSLVSVIATTSGGCIGYDTIHVEITDPVLVSVNGFVSCGSGSGSLQVTNVSGGAGSYLYSIDGTNYSTAVLFDSLSAGNYSISVKDALGCVYSFIETLDASASAPDMNFLVSTYSEKSDTLVVVNNSIYQGFDSVQWVFPPNVNVIYLSDSVAFIQAIDTGWVAITLIGFEDTCQYSLTKLVYSGESAPVYPSSMNSVNIQSITAYPNPTSGAFTVDVVFGIEQNYAIVVANELGQLIDGMTASGKAISFSTSLNFPSGLEPGSYHVYVLSDYDARELTIILN